MPASGDPRFRVVPAAYVLLRRGSGVLLQLRHNTGFMDGFWATAAAGHVEAGESVVAAAIREAREELAIEISPDALRPLCTVHRTAAPHRAVDERVDFFFECRTWTGEPVTAEPDKSAALEWFELDRLPTPIVPHEELVLDHLRSGELPPILTAGFAPDA